MTVKDLHRKAMEYNDKAIIAVHNNEDPTSHYLNAYEFEKQAYLLFASKSQEEPTRSVLLRSAASLAMMCGLNKEAEKLIALAISGNPPEEILDELRDLFRVVNINKDQDIIQNNLNKIDLALEKIVSDNKIRAYITSFVLDNGGQNHDVNDVIQESLILFYTQYIQNKINQRTTLNMYFLTCAKIVWLKMKRNRKNTIELDEELIQNKQNDVESEFIYLEWVNLIVDQLDTNCKKVLFYSYLDLSYVEIMNLMKYSSIEVAKKVAYRCREKVRKYALSNPNMVKLNNENDIDNDQLFKHYYLRKFQTGNL